MAIVIIGGGIIGASIAFHLTELKGIDPTSIHIIESSPELVASASAYAGGFLARDWFPPASASLGAFGFDLHAEFAAQYDGARAWGYSKTTSYSLRSSKTARRGEDWLISGSRASVGTIVYENKPEDEPLWLLRADGDGLDMIGKDTSAQVDPKRLTMFLLETAIRRGVKLHHPYTPSQLKTGRDGIIESLQIVSSIDTSSRSITIPCSRIILAAGAWTPHVYKILFPKDNLHIPIKPLAGHSLVVRTDKWNDTPANASGCPAGGGCHAVYSSTETPGIGEWSPEIYSRLGNELYIAGLNDPNLPLPRLATERVLESEKLKIVLNQAKAMIGVEKLSELEVLREGLCFRPITDRGTPIIGPVRDKKGVWIASGHGPWGISMSLGTGKVVAEILLGREPSCDISELGLPVTRDSKL